MLLQIEEPPAKRRRMGERWLREIEGLKYDRPILEKVDAWQQAGQLSKTQAQELWKDAQ